MFLLSYYSIIFGSLKLQNFGYVKAKCKLAVKYFNNTALDNSFMFIIVNLPEPTEYYKTAKNDIFSKVPNSTTVHHTTASQKIWGCYKPINKDYVLCNCNLHYSTQCVPLSLEQLYYI